MLLRQFHRVRGYFARLTHPPEAEAWRSVMDALEQAAVFQGVSHSALRALADVVHQRRYKRDQVLYYEGDPGLGLYIVEQGSVRLFITDEQGTQRELRQVHDGAVFGELALLGDFRRTETAQAAIDTTVLGFFAPDLKAMVKRNPNAGLAVLTALARYVGAQQVELLRLLTEADNRLAAMRLLDDAVQRVG